MNKEINDLKNKNSLLNQENIDLKNKHENPSNNNGLLNPNESNK